MAGRRRLVRLAAAALLLGLTAAGTYAAYPHLRAWLLLRSARADLRLYHNPQAVRRLQACLRTWPDDPEVLLLSARAARRAGSYDEAEALLERYRKRRGLDEAGALEQRLLSAECGVEAAMQRCQRDIEQGHPESPLLYEALARGYMRHYRLPEARGCLARWLQGEPDNPQALCLQGQFHLDYEHTRPEAIASYRRAVELDPDHEVARLGLAVALLDSKLYAEAAGQFAELLRRQPDNARVRVALATCRDGLDDRAEALRLVEQVLARQPDYAPALSLRGRLAVEQGQYAEAETWLRRAVALDATDHQAQYHLIRCLERNGKEAEAQELQRRLTRWEDDLKRFNELITRDMAKTPNDPALHCTLGELLLRSGYRDEGLRWLHSALRLDPGYAPAREALTKYHGPKNAE